MKTKLILLLALFGIAGGGFANEPPPEVLDGIKIYEPRLREPYGPMLYQPSPTRVTNRFKTGVKLLGYDFSTNKDKPVRNFTSKLDVLILAPKPEEPDGR